MVGVKRDDPSAQYFGINLLKALARESTFSKTPDVVSLPLNDHDSANTPKSKYANAPKHVCDVLLSLKARAASRQEPYELSSGRSLSPTCLSAKLLASPRNNSSHKVRWSPEEDNLLILFVQANGSKRWSEAAAQLPGRSGKQCRERWHNQLDPAINKDPWSEREDTLLVESHRSYGNKWAEIAKILEGRTDNAIKNRWNSTIQRRIPKLKNGRLDYDSFLVGKTPVLSALLKDERICAKLSPPSLACTPLREKHVSLVGTPTGEEKEVSLSLDRGLKRKLVEEPQPSLLSSSQPFAKKQLVL
mmetsp:Transcript_258/g.332  ORF Transcript_258/g.332 Transcript_258/m.332 type:complete len:303 (-) Transcript_258:219-1127(-)